MTLKAAAAGLDARRRQGRDLRATRRARRRAAARGAAATSAIWSSRSTAATSPPRTSARRPATWCDRASARNTSPGCPPIAAAPATRARSRRSGSRRRSGPAPPSASAARDLAGRTVCVVGLGHVGAGLARRLADGGCELLVTDIDPGKRALAEVLGATWRRARLTRPLAECDVLAPCALGGAIDADQRRVSCAARSSAGRPTTSSPTTRSPGSLAERGILYAPDFVANAGGLIHVFMELEGYSEERARRAGARDRGDRRADPRDRRASAGSRR